jgi:NAD(P)-dependent dehydrogenase (short-subunit alcohol dehydrogenase family)
VSRTDAPLAGRHAIITGASRGLGPAIAARLAQDGADVTLLARTVADAAHHTTEIANETGVRTAAFACDVSDPHSIAAAFGAARDRLGDAHVLVNNAGQAEGATFLETSRELWDRLLAVNLTGAFLCTQQVLPAMIAARHGRIVNIASTAGLRGVPHISAYAASKHGLVGLTRSLAREVAKLGITVNAVCPGYTDTPMTRYSVQTVARGTGRSEADALRILERTNALGRLVAPAEVAATVAWLCSPDAEGITGEAIVIGGMAG